MIDWIIQTNNIALGELRDHSQRINPQALKIAPIITSSLNNVLKTHFYHNLQK